jgi:hypothetical protein
MGRILVGILLGAGLTAALQRFTGNVMVGVVTLDEKELRLLPAKSRLTIVGIADIPSDVPAELLQAQIGHLTVLGLVQASRDSVKALSGRATVSGSIEYRD